MLRIKVEVSIDLAVIALSWYLKEEGKITDVIKFRHAIRKYISEFGWSRADHDYGYYEQERGEAHELCNKYYNK